MINLTLSAECSQTYFFIVFAAMPYNILPTGVLPVNVTFFTILFSQSSRPTSEILRSVVTMLMTPSGTLARFASSARASAENGVSAGGLMTVVQPAARAAPS
jgi:hypothetical protein